MRSANEKRRDLEKKGGSRGVDAVQEIMNDVCSQRQLKMPRPHLRRGKVRNGGRTTREYRLAACP